MSAVPKFHVYVASEVGILKGVDTENGLFRNLNNIEELEKEDEITAMCWDDASEKKVCVGQKNQIVKEYDTESQSFSVPHYLPTGEGAIQGLCCFDGRVVTAGENGTVKLWKKNFKQEVTINTGAQLCTMQPNPFRNFQIATGGIKNDLKIWDLQASSSPVFHGKNVKNDFLDLEVPIWITDLKYKSNENIVTCTRHHHIRLYDTRAQRRPVIDMEFENQPLKTLSLAHNENQVIVGSCRGRMALVDLRKKLLVHVFKGFSGGIRCIQCHPTLPLIASCGLDRFLRIHDLNTHKLLKKVYLKTRLNCLLFKTALDNPIQDAMPETKASQKEVEVVDEEEEKFWNSMSVVRDGKKLKRGLKSKDAILVKKKRNVTVLN